VSAADGATLADLTSDSSHSGRIAAILIELEAVREALYADRAAMSTLDGAIVAGDVSRAAIDLTQVVLRLVRLEDRS
jgi:hypothetical protein